jgi:predicted PurR-regulated permease PerM
VQPTSDPDHPERAPASTAESTPASAIVTASAPASAIVTASATVSTESVTGASATVTTASAALPAAGAAAAAGVVPTPTRRYSSQAFLTVFLIGTVLFAITVIPILPPVLLGALLAAFATPLRLRIERRFPGRTVAAAAITVLLVVAVLVPICVVVMLIAERLVSVLERLPELAAWIEGPGLRRYLADKPFLKRIKPADLAAQLQGVVTWLGAAIPGLLSEIFESVLSFFLTMVTTYYLLRDGRWARARLERALPLEPHHTRAIIDEFELVGRAVVVGTLGTACAQGLLAGLGYWMLDVPEPLLFGALTVVVAIIPVVGSAGVWVPITIWLAATGHVTRALILLGFGTLVVGTVDNLLRPLLSKEGLHFHPLLIFLSLFGGIAAFGASGIYLGPLFVALFVAMARIYEREMAPVATGLAEVRVPDSTWSWRLAQALGHSFRRPPPVARPK